jgi:L-aminopeptidase/D-esterase-like protein
MNLGQKNSIFDISGIRIGNWTDSDSGTGCTVIMLPENSTCGVDVRGGGPGTRETDLLRPNGHVIGANAFVFSGGSAMGLGVADGVSQYLRDINVGYQTSMGRIPIVSAAILFDLGIGDAISPKAEAGYEAARTATDLRFESGNVGAGTGATVAKLFGMNHALKGGIGSSSVTLTNETGNNFTVAALAVVNALGDIYDYQTGIRIAGPRSTELGFLDTADALLNHQLPAKPIESNENTTLVFVATDAKLNSLEVNQLASISHNGFAQSIWPVHTQGDGDLVFSAATGLVDLDSQALLGLIAQAPLVVASAVKNAVLMTSGLLEIPSSNEWLNE